MKIFYFQDIPDHILNEMVDYCHDNSLSLIQFDNTDVSDVSGQWDTIARFVIENDDHAVIFKLKYAGY